MASLIENLYILLSFDNFKVLSDFLIKLSDEEKYVFIMEADKLDRVSDTYRLITKFHMKMLSIKEYKIDFYEYLYSLIQSKEFVANFNKKFGYSNIR